MSRFNKVLTTLSRSTMLLTIQVDHVDHVDRACNMKPKGAGERCNPNGGSRSRNPVGHHAGSRLRDSKHEKVQKPTGCTYGTSRVCVHGFVGELYHVDSLRDEFA